MFNNSNLNKITRQQAAASVKGQVKNVVPTSCSLSSYSKRQRAEGRRQKGRD
ncbi:MAG: hypothetical protein F6K41_25995 [Symploca sp. SIO3E6]|nr:hypothetical protein [Caldora sp. SIO3E6]